jgi:hypothetical protein
MLVFSSLYWMVLPFAVAVADLDAERLQRQVIEYRKQLKSGHIIYHSTLIIKGEHKPSYDRKIEVWFDNKKIRNDIWLHEENDGLVFHRRVHCHHCEKEGYFVLYTGESERHGKPLAMNWQPLSGYPPGELPAPVTDPRLVGLSSSAFAVLAYLNLEKNNWLMRKDQYNRIVERGRWKGKEAVKISFMDSRNEKVSIWIVLEYGPSVVRIETRDTFSFDWIECDYEQKFGFWYPIHYTYEYSRNQQLEKREDMNIEVLSLNAPIPPEVFQLKGMKIPAGTRVSTDKGVMLWNGEELVPEEAPLRNVYRSGVGLRQWLLWGTSLVLALLAAFFVYRYFFRRSGQSASS